MAFGELKGVLTGAANTIGTSLSIGTLASGSAAVATGDLVYVVVGEQTAPTMTTVSDNLGNTYAPTQVATDAGTSTARAYWSPITVAGTITAITVVTNGGSNNGAGAAIIVEGPFDASPLDANPTNIINDITTPFTCPPSGTLAQANEVVIGWAVSTGSAVWTASAPNVLAAQIATQAILSVRIGLQTVSATTSIAPAFAGTNPTDDVLGTTSFKQMPPSPFGQDDWPVPRLRQVPPPPYTFMPNLLLSYLPPPAPFSQNDWPLPILRPYQSIEWVHTNFVLGVEVAPTVLPFNQYSWPLPPPPAKAAAIVPWQVSQPLLATSVVVAAPFVPMVFPLPPQRPPQAGAVPPQLPTMLLATPFAQRIWPVPPKSPLPLPQFTQPNIALQTLFAPGVPFAQYDWPIPRRAAPPIPQFSQPNVALQTTFVVAQPFAQYSWPNPILRQWSPPAASQASPPVALRSLVFPKPFLQSSWPLPVLSPPTFIEWVHSNHVLGAPAVAQDVLPFAQFDWPTPKVAPSALRAQVQPYNVQLYGTYVQVTPVRSAAFPLPPPAVTQIQRVVAQSPIIFTGQNQPFSQDNWPVPQRRTFAPPQAAQQMSPVLAATLVVQRPFFQSSWPVPQTPRPLVQYVILRNLHLYKKDILPFSQNSWPLPQIPRPLVQYSIPRNLQLYRFDRLPFRQSEWPLPRVAQQPMSVYGYFDTAKPGLRAFVAAKPFSQLEWPLPRIPLYPYSLYGYEATIYPLPGKFAVPPPVPPPPSVETPAGYESQVGVWHGGNVRHGRTGKRYRIYR